VGGVVHARTQDLEGNPAVAGAGMLTSRSERKQRYLPQMDWEGAEGRLNPHSGGEWLDHLEVAEDYPGAANSGVRRGCRCNPRISNNPSGSSVPNFPEARFWQASDT